MIEPSSQSPAQRPGQKSVADTNLAAGVNPAFAPLLQSRTAAKEAVFFLPHLRPGMQLLDCGCGHGAITVGLAQMVAPGHVVGIDLDEARVAAARQHAAERGVDNVEFRVGDVHRLPFPDATFDAAFEHAVLMYLPEPGAAAREIGRVLKRGGVFGARDTDFEGSIMEPHSPLLEQAMALFRGWYAHRGTDLQCGRRLRGILTGAGFGRIEAAASCDCHGTPEGIREWADTLGRVLGQPSFVDFATQSARIDQETLTRLGAAVKAWGEQPESFHASVMGEAVGWKLD